MFEQSISDKLLVTISGVTESVITEESSEGSSCNVRMRNCEEVKEQTSRRIVQRWVHTEDECRGRWLLKRGPILLVRNQKDFFCSNLTPNNKPINSASHVNTRYFLLQNEIIATLFGLTDKVFANRFLHNSVQDWAK